MSKRESLKNVEIPTYCKCEKIYPIISFTDAQVEHSTIGISLSKDQAIELATFLLIASTKWEKDIVVTAYRKNNNITVTCNYVKT